MRAELEACFGWAAQTTPVLAYHLEDLEALSGWLYGTAAPSDHDELRQANDALQRAAHNLEQLVAELRAAHTHGYNYIEDVISGGAAGPSRRR